MPRQLGVGVIGLHEGRTMLVALSTRTKYARPIAACDLSAERVELTRRVFPDLFCTTSYEELLARDEVGLVCIFTPDPLHGEHILQAFEAGKHVICTKPLVISVEDARRVLKAARQTNRKLMVGQSTRFFEPFIQQRAGYERGEVGVLELVDAHYIHRMDWFYDKSPWAVSTTDWVFLGMSHPVDLVCWYLGSIEEVHAFGYRSFLAKQYGLPSFDIYTVNFRSTDGLIGRAMGHYGVHELPSARNAIELMLYGSEGTSLAQYPDMRYSHTGTDGAEVKEDWLYSKRVYYFNAGSMRPSLWPAGEFEAHGMHYGEFANYVDYFALALLEDRDYSPNLEEGLRIFCVMEAIRRSAESRQPVKVAPLLETIGLQ